MRAGESRKIEAALATARVCWSLPLGLTLAPGLSRSAAT